jgi:hypothetical protein
MSQASLLSMPTILPWQVDNGFIDLLWRDFAVAYCQAESDNRVGCLTPGELSRSPLR